MKVKTEVRANGTEDTGEDSLGPGSNRGLAHGSSGVHKDPDKDSNVSMPSGSDGARSGRSDTHSMPSGRGFGEGGQPSGGRLTLPALASAPSMHANPLGNTTPTSRSLDDRFRGSPHAAGGDGEPNPGRTTSAHASCKSPQGRYDPDPALAKLRGTPSQDLSQLRQGEERTYIDVQIRRSSSTTPRSPTRVSPPSSTSSGPRCRRKNGRRRDTRARRERRARLRTWRNKERPRPSPA